MDCALQIRDLSSMLGIRRDSSRATPGLFSFFSLFLFYEYISGQRWDAFFNRRSSQLEKKAVGGTGELWPV